MIFSANWRVDVTSKESPRLAKGEGEAGADHCSYLDSAPTSQLAASTTGG
jgi:hypothetical protein